MWCSRRCDHARVAGDPGQPRHGIWTALILLGIPKLVRFAKIGPLTALYRTYGIIIPYSAVVCAWVVSQNTSGVVQLQINWQARSTGKEARSTAATCSLSRSSPRHHAIGAPAPALRSRNRRLRRSSSFQIGASERLAVRTHHKPPRRKVGEGGRPDLAVLEPRRVTSVRPGWHHSCTQAAAGPPVHV